MAKAKEQRGFELPRNGLMGEEKPERSIQPVKRKPRPEKPQVALKPAKEMSGAELYTWLLETGMVKWQLEGAKAWLAEHAEATGEELFRYLEDCYYNEDRRVPESSVRRAGKELWGPEWDLQTAVAANPIEEIAKLRKQVADLEMQVALKNTEVGTCKMREKHLQDRLNDQQREINALRAGRSPEDLAAILGDANTSLDPAFPG